MPPIVKIGHPALRVRLKDLSIAWIKRPATKTLVRRMARLMVESAGVGLAANQLGLPYRLFVMQRQDGSECAEAFLNPHIVAHSRGEVLDWEGCLSIPGFRGLVPRAEKVTLEAVSLEGKKVRREFSGFAARIVQHETDHLDGLLYVDRMSDMRSFMHEDEMT